MGPKRRDWAWGQGQVKLDELAYVILYAENVHIVVFQMPSDLFDV